jgi:gamma-glutamylcyclotransferase (GGCT)/AIG2-like uncharacterized protein YtfP
VEEAVVRGRLYELPSGIPVLEVPEADVLAYGTADPLADVATQARLAAEFAARAAHPEPRETNPQDGGFGRAGGTPEGREPWMASVNGAPGGRWGPVYGELLTFDDPETRLPAIDRLEGFLPDGPSLYRRVLVPASTRGQRVLVWLYVEGTGRRHPARRLTDGVWRA